MFRQVSEVSATATLTVTAKVACLKRRHSPSVHALERVFQVVTLADQASLYNWGNSTLASRLFVVNSQTGVALQEHLEHDGCFDVTVLPH